ncbi:sulfite exporter TauE/SafE family protein [Colwellia demingiae]|uniref:Probable membrane transporter protein n=1 Tax=Colwellia demingiae TaxID=89401 RepID=A0A5C6Q6C7_9GAMM|nr:sulfite exporter TauE/SafE family protein [Colwellia demingiae]TWX64338.1 sulfite exporter TauE/SafE family protein [Colwellia demingiae]
MLVTDPWFYITAIPAILIYGIGKGGLGGALGIIAVPMIALVISPMQAAAILLPILCVMDVFAIKVHYRNADYSLLKLMLPGAFVGIVVAGFFLSVIPTAGLSLLIGSLSLLFCLQYLLNSSNKPIVKNVWFWCALGGFSSTTIHAGGGPISIYLLPKRLNKLTLVATMAVLFGIINLIKLIPYTLLGNFDQTNLLTALVLMPLAPIGVKLGVMLLHRVSQSMVYRLCYLFLFLSGLKLFGDGIIG